jgi:hypothetical protein
VVSDPVPRQNFVPCVKITGKANIYKIVTTRNSSYP